MRNFRSIAACCVTLALAAAHAQQVTLSRVVFTGDPDHSQQELLAFSGLKPGPSTQQAVQDAAQRLGDTGLYDEVNFASQGPVLTYTLRPAAVVYPVAFSNFVWWKDVDLDAAIQKQVPLYRRDRLPKSGTVHDAVVEALKTLVAQQGVSAPSIDALLTDAAGQKGRYTLTFEITSPAVRVHSFALEQSSPSMQPKLQMPIAALIGERWNQQAFSALLDSRAGEAYRDEGYLDVAIGQPQFRAPAVTADSIDLDITATVTEGAQFRISHLDWADTAVLTAARFSKIADLKPGDIASARQYRNTLQEVRTAYSAQGYLAARVSATPQFDRNAHTVAYALAVEPGPQYHFKSVLWAGLTEAQTAAFQARWKLAPGTVFDDRYPMTFLHENATLFPPGAVPSTQIQVNPADQTVLVTIAFKPRVASR